MKILCIGKEDNDIYKTLIEMGVPTEQYERAQHYSQVSMEEINMLAAYIKEHGITHLISIHLIYNLSVAAAMTGIKYLSIIWDAPYDKLFTPYGRTENCWFSVFDRVDAKRFQQAGFPHVMYQPLAVNPQVIDGWKSLKNLRGNYYNDICFIGSLYDDNAYDKELGQMPKEMKIFFDSIFEEAAFRWDGVDRIFGKTENELVRYLQMVTPGFSLGNIFDLEDRQLFDNLYLGRKLANVERIGVLNMLAEYFQVTCCTYNRPVVAKLKGVRILPTIKEGEPFAVMAARSKINLNISLKGIKGGTPQRVMDIMAAGGFMMTNYCEETADLFEEGREIEMFRTPEELAEKAAYYLGHPEEREAIAEAGRQKVLADYNYQECLTRILDWAEKGWNCASGRESSEGGAKK